MKIPNRLMHAQLANQYAKKPLRSSALILGALGLAIAVSACTTTPTAEQSSSDSASVTETQSASEAATKTFVKDGVAIGGADPVAYFTEEAYVPGSDDYTHEWQGVTWQFANEENRDLFAANPEQYAPQYGGFCAWAAAAKNSLVPIDPNAWSIVDDKLYLNANKKVQADWVKDTSGFIAEADDNWPALSQ